MAKARHSSQNRKFDGCFCSPEVGWFTGLSIWSMIYEACIASIDKLTVVRYVSMHLLTRIASAADAHAGKFCHFQENVATRSTKKASLEIGCSLPCQQDINSQIQTSLWIGAREQSVSQNVNSQQAKFYSRGSWTSGILSGCRNVCTS